MIWGRNLGISLSQAETRRAVGGNHPGPRRTGAVRSGRWPGTRRACRLRRRCWLEDHRGAFLRDEGHLLPAAPRRARCSAVIGPLGRRVRRFRAGRAAAWRPGACPGFLGTPSARGWRPPGGADAGDDRRVRGRWRARAVACRSGGCRAPRSGPRPGRRPSISRALELALDFSRSASVFGEQVEASPTSVPLVPGDHAFGRDEGDALGLDDLGSRLLQSQPLPNGPHGSRWAFQARLASLSLVHSLARLILGER